MSYEGNLKRQNNPELEPTQDGRGRDFDASELPDAPPTTTAEAPVQDVAAVQTPAEPTLEEQWASVHPEVQQKIELAIDLENEIDNAKSWMERIALKIKRTESKLKKATNELAAHPSVQNHEQLINLRRTMYTTPSGNFDVDESKFFREGDQTASNEEPFRLIDEYVNLQVEANKISTDPRGAQDVKRARMDEIHEQLKTIEGQLKSKGMAVPEGGAESDVFAKNARARMERRNTQKLLDMPLMHTASPDTAPVSFERNQGEHIVAPEVQEELDKKGQANEQARVKSEEMARRYPKVARVKETISNKPSASNEQPANVQNFNEFEQGFFDSDPNLETTNDSLIDEFVTLQNETNKIHKNPRGDRFEKQARLSEIEDRMAELRTEMEARGINTLEAGSQNGFFAQQATSRMEKRAATQLPNMPLINTSKIDSSPTTFNNNQTSENTVENNKVPRPAEIGDFVTVMSDKGEVPAQVLEITTNEKTGAQEIFLVKPNTLGLHGDEEIKNVHGGSLAFTNEEILENTTAMQENT